MCIFCSMALLHICSFYDQNMFSISLLERLYRTKKIIWIWLIYIIAISYSILWYKHNFSSLPLDQQRVIPHRNRCVGANYLPTHEGTNNEINFYNNKITLFPLHQNYHYYEHYYRVDQFRIVAILFLLCSHN